MELVRRTGTWKIVAHSASKFGSVASGTSSTASTLRLSCAIPKAPLSSRRLAVCGYGVLVDATSAG